MQKAHFHDFNLIPVDQIDRKEHITYLTQVCNRCAIHPHVRIMAIEIFDQLKMIPQGEQKNLFTLTCVYLSFHCRDEEDLNAAEKIENLIREMKLEDEILHLMAEVNSWLGDSIYGNSFSRAYSFVLGKHLSPEDELLLLEEYACHSSRLFDPDESKHFSLLSEQDRNNIKQRMKRLERNYYYKYNPCFDTGIEIDCGSYGSIYSYKDEEEYFVIKKSKNSNVPRTVAAIREIALLSAVMHENIVHIYGWSYHNGYFYLLLTKGTPLPVSIDSIRKYGPDVLRALDHLHSSGFFHRDLKPEHLLLKDPEDGEGVMLIDFGISREEARRGLTSKQASPPLIAPEMFKYRQHNYDAAIDIWQFGILVAWMIKGDLFCGISWDMENIQRQIFYFKNNLPVTSMSQSPAYRLSDIKDEDARDLIRKCLTDCPEQRPKAKDLINHPFFKAK